MDAKTHTTSLRSTEYFINGQRNFVWAIQANLASRNFISVSTLSILKSAQSNLEWQLQITNSFRQTNTVNCDLVTNNFSADGSINPSYFSTDTSALCLLGERTLIDRWVPHFRFQFFSHILDNDWLPTGRLYPVLRMSMYQIQFDRCSCSEYIFKVFLLRL